MGFAGLDLGVFLAVAATLILVFVRANSEDFNRLFALVDEGEFYFVNGFFFVDRPHHLLIVRIDPPNTISLLF